MKKNIVVKKLATLGLAAVIILSLVGCSDEKEKSASTPVGTEKYKYGLISAVTGSAAAYGQAVMDGTKLAIEEINAKNGLQIELIAEDTAADKNQAINAMNKLIHKDNVLIIQGPLLSGEMFAAAPLAQQAGVPTLGTSTTAEGITDIGNYIFRNAIPESLVIPEATRKAHDLLHFKRVAIMYSNNNDMQVSVFKTYQSVLAELGVEVLGIETFADKDTDFSAQLTKIKDYNPDVLMVAALYQEGSLILKKARDMGMNMPVIGNNGFNSPELIKMAGKATDNVIVGTPWWPEKKEAKVESFIAAFNKKYGHNPDQFAAQAYDAVYLIHQAVENAKTTTDRNAVREALQMLKDFQGVTGNFEFDENRNPKMEVNVLRIMDGKYEELK